MEELVHSLESGRCSLTKNNANLTLVLSVSECVGAREALDKARSAQEDSELQLELLRGSHEVEIKKLNQEVAKYREGDEQMKARLATAEVLTAKHADDASVARAEARVLAEELSRSSQMAGQVQVRITAKHSLFLSPERHMHVRQRHLWRKGRIQPSRFCRQRWLH